MHESRHSSKANQSSTPLSDGDEPSHGVKGTFAVQRHTATSEPSHSARPSMEGDDQPKLSTRKSVAFDDSGTPERPPGADPHQSPFACVAGTDAGAALDAVLPSGSFAIPPQHLRNGRSAGMDQAATSAPPQSLDAVATTAIAQERGVNNGSAAQRLMAGNASRNFRQAGGPTTHAVVNYGGSRRRTAPASGGRPSLEVFAPSALPNESASTRIRGTSVSASEGLLSCDIAELFGEAFAAEVGTSAQPPAGISHSESRSSMDVLLSAPTPTPHARQSLDSLQELLRPVNRTHSNEQGAGTAAEALLRSSLLSGRGAFGSMAQLKLSRSPTASPRSPGLSSLTSSVTVVAQPKLRAAAMTAQPSVGALASNIVDQYNAPVPTAGRAAVARSPPGQMTTLKEEYEAAVAAGAAPAAAQLDADLHDTFGAHAWYCGPNTGAAGSSHRVSPRGVKGGNALDGQISGVVLGSGRGPGSAAVLRHTASARLASQRHMSARGTAKLLEPTTVHGQHSVTLHDSQCTVPSYDFLRQRQRARSDEASGTLSSGGGYIAEAKRVLSEAMRSGSRSDAEVRDSR